MMNIVAFSVADRVRYVKAHGRHNASLKSLLGREGYIVTFDANAVPYVMFDNGARFWVQPQWLEKVTP